MGCVTMNSSFPPEGYFVLNSSSHVDSYQHKLKTCHFDSSTLKEGSNIN